MSERDPKEVADDAVECVKREGGHLTAEEAGKVRTSVQNALSNKYYVLTEKGKVRLDEAMEHVEKFRNDKRMRCLHLVSHFTGCVADQFGKENRNILVELEKEGLIEDSEDIRQQMISCIVMYHIPLGTAT